MIALVLTALSIALGFSTPAHASPYMWRVRCELQPVGFDRFGTLLMGDIDIALGKDGKTYGWLRDGEHWLKLNVTNQADYNDIDYRYFFYDGSLKFVKKGIEKQRKYSGTFHVHMGRPKEFATVIAMSGTERLCEPGLFGECDDWAPPYTSKPFRAYCKPLN